MYYKAKLIGRYKRHFFKKTKKINRTKVYKNKVFKILFILSLILNNFGFNNFNNKIRDPFNNKSILRIFIITHKDFENFRYNPIYTIVADDKSELKNKYNLKIIYANEGKLYNLKRAYSEMSKLHYIYELYKNGSISSKYVGLNHYRRYFNFTDNIPDMDSIFENYDVILNEPFNDSIGMQSQYCRMHFCRDYYQMINIIKDIKPEYYETALQANHLKFIHCCNLFIMKKEDFFKYCEFEYDILFEFDRRNNFKTDDDVLATARNSLYHSRIQAFLSERIGNIFYLKHFKRRKIFEVGLFNYTEKGISGSFKKEAIYLASNVIFISLIISIFLSLVFLFIIFLNIYHTKYK